MITDEDIAQIIAGNLFDRLHAEMGGVVQIHVAGHGYLARLETFVPPTAYGLRISAPVTLARPQPGLSHALRQIENSPQTIAFLGSDWQVITAETWTHRSPDGNGRHTEFEQLRCKLECLPWILQNQRAA